MRVVGEARRRRPAAQRPSLLLSARLSDGRRAWPVARANGVREATFRARLKAGAGSDDLVKAVAARVPARAFHRASAVPDRKARWALGHAWGSALNCLADGYSGVIASCRNERLAVSARGRDCLLQSRDGEGWRTDDAFPTGVCLRAHVVVVACDPCPDLLAAALALPDDPRACQFVPMLSKAQA